MLRPTAYGLRNFGRALILELTKERDLFLRILINSSPTSLTHLNVYRRNLSQSFAWIPTVLHLPTAVRSTDEDCQPSCHLPLPSDHPCEWLRLGLLGTGNHCKLPASRFGVAPESVNLVTAVRTPEWKRGNGSYLVYTYNLLRPFPILSFT